MMVSRRHHSKNQNGFTSDLWITGICPDGFFEATKDLVRFSRCASVSFGSVMSVDVFFFYTPPYPMISHNIPIGLLSSTQPKLPPSQVTGGPGRLYDRSSGGRDAAAVSLRLGFIGKWLVMTSDDQLWLVMINDGKWWLMAINAVIIWWYTLW